MCNWSGFVVIEVCFYQKFLQINIFQYKNNFLGSLELKARKHEEKKAENVQKHYIAPSQVFWNSNRVKYTFTSPRQEDSDLKLLAASYMAPWTFL